MKTGRTALQVARIIALLLLLRTTGWYAATTRPRLVAMQLDDLWVPWAGISLISVLFVTVMLVGRRRWHPWGVLGVEALVAAVLAFMMPVQWVLWLGVGGLSNTMTGGFVQPLAVAWLGVVVARGVHQRRDAEASSPQRVDGPQ